MIFNCDTQIFSSWELVFLRLCPSQWGRGGKRLDGCLPTRPGDEKSPLPSVEIGWIVGRRRMRRRCEVLRLLVRLMQRRQLLIEHRIRYDGSVRGGIAGMRVDGWRSVPAWLCRLRGVGVAGNGVMVERSGIMVRVV